MINIIKGWITSLLGLGVAIMTALYWLGLYHPPYKSGLGTGWEIAIGFIISVGFFVIPYTRVESFVEQLWSSIIRQFKMP